MHERLDTRTNASCDKTWSLYYATVRSVPIMLPLALEWAHVGQLAALLAVPAGGLANEQRAEGEAWAGWKVGIIAPFSLVFTDAVRTRLREQLPTVTAASREQPQHGARG